MTRSEQIILGPEEIAQRILVLRGQRVLLDADPARIYGVPTKRLNEQVKRNARRFPEDFVFQLTREELEAANRSQNATGSQRHRDPRFLPYAFTEHGAIQAANVLNSEAAIEMGVHVVRAFVRLRQWLSTQKAFAAKLDDEVRKHVEGVGLRNRPARGLRPRVTLVGRPTGRQASQLESRVGQHDEQFTAVIEALRQLTASPEPHHGRKMGFPTSPKKH